MLDELRSNIPDLLKARDACLEKGCIVKVM